jgi:TP901 family phage tail tape measure protein
VSEVHRASSSLQQLQRELLSSNRAIASSTKLANNLFRDTLTGSGQFSSHFVNLNSDVDKFGKNLDAGRLKLKNYFSTFREHATTQKGMIRELAKEQVMLQNSVLQPLGRNAQGLMQYNVMIPRGLDAVKNSAQLARMEMQIMNRALSEGAGSLINWGKNTQWAGRQLTVGLTVPLTMFGAAAGKAFREADQELVRLTKVYGGLSSTSAADLKAIREEVVQTAKSLSQTMGASFKDTIALGADIAATGKMGNDLLGSIEETTRLAILGEVDRQDAMKATLSIQTAFKQNTEELTASINFLNAVENQTSTTLNDLVEAIPKAGPVVQQLGGSIEDLALYMTAMREGGINASEGANALKSGLASLINPTKQTVGMMSDFGIDVMGMVAKNTGDTTGLLMDLQFALDKLDPLSKARAMEQMFGKFQFARMSALLNNLGKEGSQTLQVMELMKASTSDLAGIAERELGMITESASGKYRRAMESLKASLADIGEDFLPVATKLINAASKILDFFSNLPAPIKKAVTFMAGFTALVGPLIMLTGVLANFFGYITKGIVQLRAFFMKASGWKMLTPEIIAAQKAAEMVENAFYSDAAAAQVLHNALQKLVLDYQNLQAASMKGAVPVNPGVSTVGGSTIVTAGRRIVDASDPYVGDPNTRAMSHINPRDPNNPATIFGGVPGAVPVNRGIARTPQMYMHDRLPNVEGLTSVKGISTGIVPGEAAKFHALMATLGMQTEQEVASLKKTIAMGGTVSRELLDTFDDILPITQ